MRLYTAGYHVLVTGRGEEILYMKIDGAFTHDKEDAFTFERVEEAQRALEGSFPDGATPDMRCPRIQCLRSKWE